MLRGNREDLGVLQEGRVGRAQRGVRLREDALRLEEYQEVVLRQVRVQLDLIRVVSERGAAEQWMRTWFVAGMTLAVLRRRSRYGWEQLNVNWCEPSL